MKDGQRTTARREFLGNMTACGLCLAGILPVSAGAALAGKGEATGSRTEGLKEAYFSESLGNGKTRCLTCPNMCVRDDGEVTFCNTRINKGGRLYSLTYSKPCLLNVDNIAKNPLYHVDPGASALGVATAGCNLRCKYCQNWEISQVGPDKTKNMDLSPLQLIEKVKEKKLKWITFSYTEPVAYFEYALDTAKLAKGKGLNVAICTAGNICDKPLAELIRYADAFSVTMKGYSEDFYRDVASCSFKDVWRSINSIQKARKWIEVVTLIVPGVNDDMDGIKKIASGLAGISRDIPLHFLRFAPAFKMRNLPATPVQTLEKAHETAKKAGLKYVYIDLSGHRNNTVYCAACGKALIERTGFAVVGNELRKGKCSACSATLPGLMLQ